jgi:predicted  nucleic acid-binding Zn-ribbon protein
MSDEAVIENPDNMDANANDLEVQLDKLYDRIPKLLSHITTENAARHGAIDKLLANFDKINDVHAEMGDEAHENMSLATIYGLAVNGGGGNADELDELRDANGAFAEENEILSQTIESLGFEIKSMREKAADELILNDDLDKNSIKRLKDNIKTVQKILATLGKYASAEEDPNQPAQTGKSFDERLTEELSGLTDITGAMMATSSKKPTMLGRFFRRLGFAYDFKDAYVARRVVSGVIKVNREQNDIIRTLRPMQEQLDKIHQIVEVMELIASHEERQSPHYQEAMDEIDNLKSLLERHEERSGDLKGIETQILEKESDLTSLQADIDELINQRESVASDVKEARRKAHQEMDELRENVDGVRDEHVQPDDETALDDEEPEDCLSDKTLKELRREHRNLKKRDERKQDKLVKYEGELDKANNEMNRLETALSGTKSELNDLRSTQSDYQGEIKHLKNRLMTIEDGLLVKKLEHEIAQLRGTLVEEETKTENEKEAKEALESRIVIWVKEQEELEKQVSKWQKRATFNWSATAVSGLTACGLSAAAAFAANSFLVSTAQRSVEAAFIPGLLVPATVIGVIGLMAKVDEEKDETRLKNAGGGAIIGAVFGGLITALNYASIDSNTWESARNECQNGCVVVAQTDDAGQTLRVLTQIDELTSRQLAGYGLISTRDPDKNDPRRLGPQ